MRARWCSSLFVFLLVALLLLIVCSDASVEVLTSSSSATAAAAEVVVVHNDDDGHARRSPWSRADGVASPPSPAAHAYPADYELQLVQVVTRHGDRTPISTLPRSLEPTWTCDLTLAGIPSAQPSAPLAPGRMYRKAYIDGQEILPGNCGTGQLTTIGAQQHAAIGQAFRTTYVDQLGYLPSQFDPSLVYLRSTDVQRTQESAMAQMLAFFPPTNYSNSAWEMLTINSQELELEDFLASAGKCPRLGEAWAELRNSTTYQQFQAKMQPLKSRLKAAWQGTEFPEWGSYWDVVITRISHSFPLPPSVSTQDVQDILNAAVFDLQFLYSTVETRTLGMGRAVAVLVRNMQQKMQGALPYKFMLFSAHDTTVGPLLTTLGIPQSDYPRYASHIVFELFKRHTDGQYYIRMMFNDNVVAPPTCHQQEFCLLSDFLKTASSVIPTNYAQQCTPKAAVSRRLPDGTHIPSHAAFWHGQS